MPLSDYRLLPPSSSLVKVETHVSRWYTESEKMDFYARSRPGDLVEFDRGSYRHWAVFVGKASDFIKTLGNAVHFECAACSQTGDRCRCHRFYVVHRANPGDSNALSFFFRSQSFAKGAYGVGTVILEVMDGVWSGSKARKNNRLDRDCDSFTDDMILSRAFRLFHKHARGEGKGDEYNLITNNCEHFACWCRYGRKDSTQVTKGAVMLGVTAVTATAAVVRVTADRTTEKSGENKENQSPLNRIAAPFHGLIGMITPAHSPA